jgi:hypothetical protein
VKAARQKIAKQLPKKEAKVVMKIAAPARPCFAIGLPSRQMMADDGVPGTLRRIDAIEPPYCAP